MNVQMYKSTNTNTNHPQPLYSLLSIVVPPPNYRDLSSHLQRIFLEIAKKSYFDSNYILASYIHQSFSQVVVCIEERLPSFVNQIDVPKLLTETCNKGSLHLSLQKVFGNCTCEVCTLYKEKAPVKVFNHAFQLLQFLNTEFVLLQQPDCAWAKKLPQARKTFTFWNSNIFSFFWIFILDLVFAPGGKSAREQGFVIFFLSWERKIILR